MFTDRCSMLLLTTFLILWIPVIPALADYNPAENPPEEIRNPAPCNTIEDSGERLRCYDGVAGMDPARNEPSAMPAGSLSGKKEESESYFSRIWELSKSTRRDTYTFRLHRSTYVLPFTYNNTPNAETVREADPERSVEEAEVAFQMSFKIKLLEGILARDVDLWFGYTQRSFWQLYNFADSRPFRDTNYEPEFLLIFKPDYDILGMKWRFLSFGMNHQSNGQSEPLSRSWNRVVADFGFEREPFSFLLKTWYRIPEAAEDDDNPDIGRYMGNGEFRAYYFYKKHRLGLMFRNSLRRDANRSAIELEWSFPLFFENVAGYLQYYNGYGESLLDYNHHTNRVGVGVIVIDWK